MQLLSATCHGKPMYVEQDITKKSSDCEDFYIRDFLEQKSADSTYDVGDGACIALEIMKLPAGRMLIYWSAAKLKADTADIIPSAKHAHKNFSNSGCTTVSANGRAVLKLHCPRVYQSDCGGKLQTSCRHVHFVLSDRVREHWEPRIYAVDMVCNARSKDVQLQLDIGNVLMLNSTPDGPDLPRGVHFSHQSVSEFFNRKSRCAIQNQVRRALAPDLALVFGDAGRFALTDVPIIVYGADDDAGVLSKMLHKAGFKNVRLFIGDLEDFTGSDSA